MTQTWVGHVKVEEIPESALMPGGGGGERKKKKPKSTLLAIHEGWNV